MAIWEYDPTLPQNCLLEGSIDVIATLRMLVIKIQSSRQCIVYFEWLQTECGIKTPLQIPLHSNIHWGTADGMLMQSYDLQMVLSTFRIIVPISNDCNSQSIYSSTWQTSCSAWLHLSNIQQVQTNAYPGLPSVSRHTIGTVSMTCRPLYLMQMLSNKSFLMNINQPSGLPYPHSKNFRLLGRRSATLPDIINSRMQ